MSKTLIFGAGWLGGMLAERIPGAEVTSVDIADPDAVERVLDRVGPDRIVNAAAKTGRPNIDSLEADPEPVWRSNVEGPVVLAKAAVRRSVHMTHFGSGCIYSGDNGGVGFTEEDPPNFSGSLYSRTKAAAEVDLRAFPVLQVRLRMPISSAPHPRNLLTKILAYPTVIDVPNSITVVEDMWPALLSLMDRRAVGVWNLVNEGVERHGELLGLWRALVDPSFAVRTCSEEELQRRIVAPRSNCVLSTEKLRTAGLGLPPLEVSLPSLVRRYARNLAGTASPGGP